ncbi:MAG TPA: hypothetical protein VN685_11700 [Rhizomicrobium sp.]|nr:hypothetical protein [Rhizomicrobium sp.]
MRYGLALSVSVLVGCTGSAMAGVVVTTTHTHLDTHQADTANIYVEADKLKVVSPDTTMIYRADLNRVWAINAGRRSYVEITPETMQQMAGQISGAQAQMQARLAQLPPEQRAQIEALMASRGLGGAPGARAGGPPPKPQIAYAKTGNSKTVGNWRCDFYRKTRNGEQEEDVCLAPIGSVGLSAADFQVLERMSAFIAPITSSPVVPRTDYLGWDAMNKAVGFQAVPLDTLNYVAGKPDAEDVVTKIERTMIPASTFELPPGLTKQDMAGGFGPH